MISVKDQGLFLNKYRGELMGIASLWIVIMHSFNELFPIKIPVFSEIMARGNIGVEIFLLLSGIGLYYSLSKNSNVKGFYIKRINRVVIPWLIVSLPYWICIDLLHYHLPFKSFLLDYSGLSLWINGIQTVWYVSFILIMYIVYPLIFKVQKKFAEFPLVLALIAIAANVLLFKLAPDYYKKIEIAINRIPVFLFGSYLGECISNYEKGKKSLPAAKYCVWTYFIISVILFTIGLAKISDLGDISTMFYRYGAGGTTIAIMAFCCFILNFKEFKWLRSFLKIVGSISLEFYLINVFLRNAIRVSHFADNYSSYGKLLVSFVLVIVSAIITYVAVKLIDISKVKTILNRFIK